MRSKRTRASAPPTSEVVTIAPALTSGVSLETATKIALTSMMSTAAANVSVGPPYDALIYRNGSFEPIEVRINADSPYLDRLHAVWERHLLAAIDELPALKPGDLDS